MSKFTAEAIGTMLLIIFGDGVVANVVLKRTKGHGSGWIVVAAGWGMAVALAAYSVGRVSGAHLNPAITVAFAATGRMEASQAPLYIAAQMLGAIAGAAVVWLAYLPHWAETPETADKLGVFCTAPAIRKLEANLLCEAIGTFLLVFCALAVPSKANLSEAHGFSQGLGPLLGGLIVFAIGLSLGGPTGYAINPARDLGPRIAHALLPIAGKGGSDWEYAWVPVAGPVLGGLAGAILYQIAFSV